MSVVNFIQTIWSKKIQDDLELKLKLIKNCTREYEGDCKYAQTVKILGVGDPTVSGYQGVVDYEDMSDSSQLLTIAFAEYFSFAVKDIDKAQSVPGTGNLEVGYLSSVDFSADRKDPQLP